MADPGSEAIPPVANPAIEAGLIDLLARTSGISAEALETAIGAAAAAEAKKAETSNKRSIYQDREPVYDDEQAFIFRRGSTKSRTFYLRIYDSEAKKPYVKSLGTTDRVAALTKARLIYQEIKGKVARGERLKSVTNRELVRIHLSKLEKTVTTVPHQGITPGTFSLKAYYLNMWLRFIKHLELEMATIDRIPPEKTRDFGMWFFNEPKETGDPNQPRSIEQINNAISEVTRMFQVVGVRDRFISKDRLPEIDRMKQPPDERYKRDILTTEQWERLARFMWIKWSRLKELKPLEKQRRLVFFYSMGVLYNTGLRPKELLGLKVSEISPVETDDADIRKTHLKIFIRAENSKTGRSRVVVAPIKNRIEKIKAAYKAMGKEHKPQDFLLFTPTNDERRPYTRQALYQRLQEVLKKSGLKEELDREGKKVSLYSSRHAFITWRLRYGNVPIHLVAKVAGTSIQKIEQTYGHIEVEKQTALVTRNQSWAAKAGVVLTDRIDGEEH